MQIARLPDIDDNTWADVKAYVEGLSQRVDDSSAPAMCDVVPKTIST